MPLKIESKGEYDSLVTRIGWDKLPEWEEGKDRVVRGYQQIYDKEHAYQVQGEQAKHTTMAMSVALAASAATTALIGRSILKTAGDWQHYETVLTGVMGSQRAAHRELEYITELGQRAPFGEDQLIRADMLLRNYAESAGLAGVNIHELMQDVIDLSARWESTYPGAIDQITRYMGQAMAGRTDVFGGRYGLGLYGVTPEALARYGVELDRNNQILSDTATVMKAIHRLIQATYGGEAARMMADYNMQVERLHKTMSGLAVSVGTRWLPTATKVFETSSAAVKSLTDWNEAMFGIPGTLATIAGGVIVLTSALAVATKAWRFFGLAQMWAMGAAGAGGLLGSLRGGTFGLDVLLAGHRFLPAATRIGGAGLAIGAGEYGFGKMGGSESGLERAGGALSLMGSRALAGALAGSFIPVIGTLGGAIIGGFEGVFEAILRGVKQTKEEAAAIKDPTQAEIAENTKRSADGIERLSAVIIGGEGVRSTLYPSDIAASLRGVVS